MSVASTLSIYLSRRIVEPCRSMFVRTLLVACVLAELSGPGYAEFPKYLPEGCNLIFTVNVADLYDNPSYQKLRNDISSFADAESSWQNENCPWVPLSNVAQLTLSSNLVAPGIESGPLLSVRTRKPISAAEMLAARKVPAAWKDYTITETKVGNHTIYEGRYAWAPGGEKMNGEALVVVDDHLLLYGPNAGYLRKVLVSQKPPILSPELQSLVNATDFNKTVAWVLDLKAVIDDRFERSFKRDRGGLTPLFGDAIDLEFVKNLNGLAIDAALTQTGVIVRPSLVAGDAEKARDVKTHVDAAQVALRENLKRFPRIPKEIVALLDTMTFPLDGAKVRAVGDVRTGVVVQWIGDEFNSQKKKK